MKDLFSGALGKTDFHGGSKLFTTPHTVNLAPEYFINFNINRNFVTCSLDGRLWAYGSGTTYVLFALKWNEENSRLEQSAYLNFRGEKIKARGINWFLTDKTLIYASDDEPYINTESLFDAGNGRFLYSILRSSILDGSAWGKDYDGNSEGWGFFNKFNILAMELCYSSLQAVGDWYITPNFLVRRDYKKSYNSMRILRPLIPLEFNGSDIPSYGTGYTSRNIQLVHRDNKIFARGVHHIGRCYLLPAVFSEEGEPIEFYLYICPDFIPNSNDDVWLNLAVTVSKNGSAYGFITEKSDSLSDNMCQVSKAGKVFIAQSGEWQEIEGSIFLDTLNSAALALSDDGLTLFLDDINALDCNAFNQWLAPSGNISCITDNIICSMSDEAMLTTNISRLFSRVITNTKRLPLSAVTYKNQDGQNIRVSLGETNETRKNISVNHFVSPEIKPSIVWEDIFRQAVSIKLLDTFELPFFKVFYINGFTVFSSGLRCHLTRLIHYEYQVDIDVPADNAFVGLGTDSYGVIKDTDIVHYVFIDLFVFNQDTGKIETHHFSHPYANFLPPFEGDLVWLNEAQFPYTYWPPGQKLYCPYGDLTIHDGMIGFWSRFTENVSKDDRDLVESKPEFIPFASADTIVPSSWQSGSDGLSIKLLALPNGKLNGLPENCSSAAYAVFSEKYTNTNFALHLPSLFYCDDKGNISGFFSEAKSFHFYECHSDNCSIHFVANDTQDKIAVLRSEVFNDIFNFYDELQRSAST